VLEAAQRLWRVYFAAGDHPTSWDQLRKFGPVESSRFDHQQPPPLAPERAIIYLADSVKAAIVETFQKCRTVHRSRGRPYLASLRLASSLDVLDLTASWPTYAGCSQELGSGRRSTARLWSCAVHAQYREVVGLRYRSSMSGGDHNFALYERATGEPPTFRLDGVLDLNRPLDDVYLAEVVSRVAEELGYRVL